MTQNETIAETIKTTKNTLLTTFNFYFKNNKLIPLPSPLNNHNHFIEIPLNITSKILLLNTFLQSKITQQKLTKQINKPKQKITHLFNLHHTTKIDTIQLTTKTLNKKLSLIII